MMACTAAHAGTPEYEAAVQGGQLPSSISPAAVASGACLPVSILALPAVVMFSVRILGLVGGGRQVASWGGC